MPGAAAAEPRVSAARGHGKKDRGACGAATSAGAECGDRGDGRGEGELTGGVGHGQRARGSLGRPTGTIDGVEEGRRGGGVLAWGGELRAAARSWRRRTATGRSVGVLLLSIPIQSGERGEGSRYFRGGCGCRWMDRVRSGGLRSAGWAGRLGLGGLAQLGHGPGGFPFFVFFVLLFPFVFS